MLNILHLNRFLFKGTKREKNAIDAYNIWATKYDEQPNNLMFYLDEQVFSNLLERIEVTNKTVIDIGCGTGRHWAKIQSCKPWQFVGYDVSDGMLTELKKKFPNASVQLSTDNILSGIIENSVDVIISTLTMAHIENIEEVFAAWARVLKHGGDILLTDFHPTLLAEGGKRDFKAGNERFVIKNYVHTLHELNKLAIENDLELLYKEERFIDKRVEHFYAKQKALHVYEKFKGKPVIYGLHFKKQ